MTDVLKAFLSIYFISTINVQKTYNLLIYIYFMGGCFVKNFFLEFLSKKWLGLIRNTVFNREKQTNIFTKRGGLI